MTTALLILFGFLAGVFGGMGFGGGTALIPLLTIFLEVPQRLAQGYNLLSFVLVAVISIIVYAKNKMIDFKTLCIILPSGAAFCVGGAYLVTIISPDVLRIIFGVFLILLSVYQFVFMLKQKKQK